MTDHAVLAVEIRKDYRSAAGRIPAVKGIDLHIPMGEVFANLGPDGAGKSTAPPEGD